MMPDATVQQEIEYLLGQHDTDLEAKSKFLTPKSFAGQVSAQGRAGTGAEANKDLQMSSGHVKKHAALEAIESTKRWGHTLQGHCSINSALTIVNSSVVADGASEAGRCF